MIALVESNAQTFHAGLFAGASAYNGDLVTGIFPKQLTNGAAGITGNYEISEQVLLRAGVTYSILGGADRYSPDTHLVRRNLSFETTLWEFQLVGEYYLFNLYERKYSPYVFAGAALFRFNPYAYTVNQQQVYLQPLSTEGQGVPGYNIKPYKLTQLGIPFGGGIKYAFTDDLRLGVEFGLRKLFTDYLDDVSRNYADRNELLTAKGQLAVDMAYRGDELPGGNAQYPQKGAQRGSPKSSDYYYFAGLHFSFRLGNGGGGFPIFNGRGKYGCPTVPQ